MANGILKVGEITTSSGSGNITIGSGVTLLSNTPAFEANLSATQTLTDSTLTKLQIDAEDFDTDGCYDNTTNYRFTPTVAGKYYVYTQATFLGSGGINDSALYIYKNGSLYIVSLNNDSAITTQVQFVASNIDMNGTTDYLEIYANNDVAVGSSCQIHGGNRRTIFGAYRIGA